MGLFAGRLCVLAATAAVLASCGGGSDKPQTAAAAGVAGPSEVMAEPVSSAGANPFTDPTGKDMAGLEPPSGATGNGGGPPTFRGSLPGLYGGTRNYATCDAEKLILFLEANPDKAAAWASTLGIRPHQIRRYVHRLTPVLLRTDTRVTNHGFVDGRATAIQSVLEAGTAVFVTRYGEPVVKCYCGNPLTPPSLYRAPVYVGPRWPRFRTRYITIIERTTTIIIETFRLYDPHTGKVFTRPAGTSGQSDLPGDQDLPAPMLPVPPTETTPATPPPVQQPTETTPSQPQQEDPRAAFAPNPGVQGDTFTLVVGGFAPGANLDVTLTRPDGHVEHYAIPVEPDGEGRYVFSNTENVVTGTYNATVTNPASGAETHASVQVLPRGGP